MRWLVPAVGQLTSESEIHILACVLVPPIRDLKQYPVSPTYANIPTLKFCAELISFDKLIKIWSIDNNLDVLPMAMPQDIENTRLLAVNRSALTTTQLSDVQDVN